MLKLCISVGYIVEEKLGAFCQTEGLFPPCSVSLFTVTHCKPAKQADRARMNL